MIIELFFAYGRFLCIIKSWLKYSRLILIMLKRLINPLKSNSFFLFGARGTGKTTFLKEEIITRNSLYIDLLTAEEFNRYRGNPDLLSEKLELISKNVDRVVIDEVQKVPSLLDTVHKLIEEKGIKFALTGSSARKIRRGSANLLAGRAFVNNLYPLSYSELKENFNLHDAIEWGTLPKIYNLITSEEKFSYLNTYTFNYLKEEILQEQVVRNLDPFSKFLEVAAQMNSEIINYSKIAKEAETSPNSVQSYFEILQDTLLGTIVPSYHQSIRKQQRSNPKFYFFDTGVQRALAKTITVGVHESTYYYGKLFETFIVNEIFKLNSYNKKNYSFSYLRTKSNAEVDLIIERPGCPTALLEIKSASKIDLDDLRHLRSLAKDIDNGEAFCLSQDKNARIIEGVRCLPWKEGFEELGLTASSF